MIRFLLNKHLHMVNFCPYGFFFFAGHQNHKFVSADSKGVPFSERVLQGFSDKPKHGVSGCVTLCIVQLMESVDIYINAR